MDHLKMGPIVDCRYLRSAGRDVAVPFRLNITCDGRSNELVCSMVLRVLPEKRLVCFGEWNGEQVVAKLFLDRHGAKRRCSREKKGVNALRDADVQTPPLLFTGVLQPDGTPILLFRRILDAKNVMDAWEETKDDDRRRELLARLVTVIAHQHEAGIKQDDLHLRNFLLTGRDIYTIDGATIDAGQIGKLLPEAKSLRNLGQVFAQLYPRFDFLVPGAFQVYAEKRGWPIRHDLKARLIKEVRNRRNCRRSDYLKKVYRECSAFVCQRTWGSFMVCNRDFHNEAMTGFLADPDSMIDERSLLKDGNTSTVALVEVGGHRMAVKRYNIKNTRHAFKRCLRPSRAWVSWRNAHRLSLLGIRTPMPIALLEKRWGPFRSKAYFIAEYVEGVDAYHLLHSDEAEGIDKENVAKLFGELLRSLAGAHISHGDFKATNFLVADKELFLVDLDAMREHRFRWRFRLAFGRDCERLMKNWQGMTELTRIFRAQLTALKRNHPEFL